MSRLGAALEQLEESLRRLGRAGLVGALRPGLRPEAVAAQLGRRGLQAPPEVVEIFGWHDGVDEPADRVMDDVQLFPGFYMVSLEGCLMNYDVFVRSSRWSPAWFPFLANGGGDFYFLDLSVSPPTVGNFEIYESDVRTEFSTLLSFIETEIVAIDSGIVHVAGGFLEMDDLAFAELAAAREPRLSAWRD